MPDPGLRRSECTVFGRANTDGEDGVSFVRDWVYRDRGYAATGFKLMYYDGRAEPLLAMRSYLESENDWHFLGVPPAPVKKRHFDELRTHFAGTRYERHFS